MSEEFEILYLECYEYKQSRCVETARYRLTTYILNIPEIQRSPDEVIKAEKGKKDNRSSNWLEKL
jgi:hypothetical protein